MQSVEPDIFDSEPSISACPGTGLALATWHVLVDALGCQRLPSRIRCICAAFEVRVTFHLLAAGSFQDFYQRLRFSCVLEQDLPPRCIYVIREVRADWIQSGLDSGCMILAMQFLILYLKN